MSLVPGGAQSNNREAITIVVLGGVSIMGGEGGIVGVVLATLLVIFLYNGLGLLLGTDSGIWQPFALGILLIGSALFHEFLRRRVSAA